VHNPTPLADVKRRPEEIQPWTNFPYGLHFRYFSLFSPPLPTSVFSYTHAATCYVGTVRTSLLTDC